MLPDRHLAEFAEHVARLQSTQSTIARSLSLGLLASDQTGHVWFCNAIAANWLDIRVGDSLKTHLSPSWFDPTEWPLVWQSLQRGEVVCREQQQGEQWFEIRLEPLLYQSSSAPLEQADQPSTGLLLLLENITARKHMQADLYQVFNRGQEFNELKSRFISTISHEFRTPLTTIQLATELLESYDWSPQEQQEHCQQIYCAVQYMTQLLEDVLLIDKGEAGKLQFHPQSINLTEFCRKFVADVQMNLGSQHSLQLLCRGQSRPVQMDPKLLHQILVNLLSNAIKYSPDGGPIELIVQYQTAAVILQVCDQGIGIPDADRNRLFDYFHRANNVGTIAGTGLGLAIVKKSVELHGGSVLVESQLGLGTQVTVSLPVSPARVYC